MTAWFDRLEGACKSSPNGGGEPVMDAAPLAELVAEAAETYFRMSVANALVVERESDQPVRVMLRAGFRFEAAAAKYNRKILAANLDVLEQLYGSGASLPNTVEDKLLAELRPLAAANSPLLAERPALGERLRT